MWPCLGSNAVKITGTSVACLHIQAVEGRDTIAEASFSELHRPSVVSKLLPRGITPAEAESLDAVPTNMPIKLCQPLSERLQRSMGWHTSTL